MFVNIFIKYTRKSRFLKLILKSQTCQAHKIRSILKLRELIKLSIFICATRAKNNMYYNVELPQNSLNFQPWLTLRNNWLHNNFNVYICNDKRLISPQEKLHCNYLCWEFPLPFFLGRYTLILITKCTTFVMYMLQKMLSLLRVWCYVKIKHCRVKLRKKIVMKNSKASI